MRRTIVQYFLISAALILLLTGSAKLISAFGSSKILHENDPILAIPNRLLLLLAGIVEIGTAVSVFLGKSKHFLCLWISVLGAQFLLYRCAFELGGFSRGCPCLGTLGAALPFSQSTLDHALLLIAIWLCVGGVVSFFVEIDRLKEGSAKVQSALTESDSKVVS